MADTMIKAVEAALSEFCKAYDIMMRATVPFTPAYTRFKTFRGHGFCWPSYDGEDFKQDHTDMLIGRTQYSVYGSSAVARTLVEYDKYQPHLIWRDIRAIQRAAQYCRRLAEGRQRAAQEILKQQNKYLEKIRAEVAMNKLAK